MKETRYDLVPFFIVVFFLIMVILMPRKAASEPILEDAKEEESYYIECGLSKEEQDFLYELCQEKGVDFTLALAIIWQESNFDASIVSETDDWGLMQINSINHSYYEEYFGITDFLDPYQNMTVGVDILSKCLNEFDKPFAIMAYNRGISGTYALIDEGIYTISYVEEVLEKEQILIEMSQEKSAS